MDKKRRSSYSRKTNETEVKVELDLDGKGSTEIKTKINFFDHMLEQLGKHSGFDLKVKASGDLEIDDHHTVEDIGITLGECFNQALGDKKGIARFADTIIPLDESLVRIVVDISGRPYLYSNLKFNRELVGDLSTENINEFLRGFVNHARLTLHLDLLRGDNAHHQVEAVFKGLALVLKKAVKVETDRMPSTKGML